MKPSILWLFAIAFFVSCTSENSSPVNELNPKMVEFAWDLSKDKNISYSLKHNQTMINSSLFSENEEFDTTIYQTEINVILEIKDEKMNLILNNQKGKAIQSSPISKQKDTVEIPPSKQIIPGFNKFGKNEARPEQSEMILAFFPIPYGEKCDKTYYEIETVMPFNTPEASLAVKGLRKITLKDSVIVKNHKCVKIEVETNYNEIELPPGLEGEYACEISSKFWGYYDYEAGYYIEGHDDVKFHMTTETKMPDLKGNGKEIKDRKMEMVNMQKMDFILEE